MTTIFIYKLRSDKKMDLTGIWKGGTWKLDKRGFAEISNIEQYTAEMLLDRFDGPVYFAVKAINAAKTTSTIEGSHNRSAVAKFDAEEDEVNDFVRKKKEVANRLEAGTLDKSNYSDEWIEKIKNSKWYDG